MPETTYRGHKIEVTKEESLGCGVLLYLFILRLDDYFIVEETPYDGSETPREMIEILKGRVDEEIELGGSYEPVLKMIDGEEKYFKPKE